jgi:iron complex outermembrane receptor protein
MSTNVYASYARGYKGPGMDAPANARSFNENPLLEEYVDAYELGVKVDAARQPRNLQRSRLFWQEFEDLQQQRAFDPELKHVADGDQRRRLTAARPGDSTRNSYATENLTLTANVVYLDSEYTDFQTPQTASRLGLRTSTASTHRSQAVVAIATKDVSGEPVIYSPEWSYNLAANYRRPIGNKLNALVRLDYRFRGRTAGPLIAEPVYDPRFLRHNQPTPRPGDRRRQSTASPAG